VALILTVHCTFISAAQILSVKVVSELFGGPDAYHAQPMRRSMANPSLWGLTVHVPRDHREFIYKYIVRDAARRLWCEAGRPHAVRIAGQKERERGGALEVEIEVEDVFQSAELIAEDDF
jgi:hypothetical protein